MYCIGRFRVYSRNGYDSKYSQALLATTFAKKTTMFTVKTFCWFQVTHAEMAASQYQVNLVIIACVLEITTEGFVMVWNVQCLSSLKTSYHTTRVH